MKRFVAASAVAILMIILATPSFARGPGWGRGNDTEGSWGRGSGHCWQTERGYADFAPEQRKERDHDARQNYEQFAPNAQSNGWFGRNFGRHMRGDGSNMGYGHMGIFGMGWWR
jgi:hypothetical protein